MAAQQLHQINQAKQLLSDFDSDVSSSLLIFEETHMFQPVWGRKLVAVACLLSGAVLVPTAQAGMIPPASEIEGNYSMNTLETNNPRLPYPVSFKLSDGIVEEPSPQLTGFTASNLNVNIPSATAPVSLGITDFILSGTTLGSGSIDYKIVVGSPKVETANVLTSGLTFVSNTTSVNLANLAPKAQLILTFPTDVKFEPSTGPNVVPVEFQIVPVPEPSSLVLFSWGSALGLLGYWLRHRRVARAAVA